MNRIMSLCGLGVGYVCVCILIVCCDCPDESRGGAHSQHVCAAQNHPAVGNADAPAVGCVGTRRHCISLKLLKSVVCKERKMGQVPYRSVTPGRCLQGPAGHLGSSALK